MIVMSYVPGTFLRESRPVDGEAAWPEACREAGRAIGLLTCVSLREEDRVAFESRFYRDLPTLAAYLGRILELGRGIHARDPDFRDGFWRESLDLVEAEMPGILAEPAVLYHQDVANLHVRQGRFMGFFDLEMCRVGCATMQLASSLGMLAQGEGDGADVSGWLENFSGRLGERDGQGAWCSRSQGGAGGGHLLSWREISRYMSYDGTPGTGFAWCGPAEPGAVSAVARGGGGDA